MKDILKKKKKKKKRIKSFYAFDVYGSRGPCSCYYIGLGWDWWISKTLTHHPTHNTQISNS